MSAPEVHGPEQLPDLRLWLAEQWEPGRTFHDVAGPQLAARLPLLHPDDVATPERTRRNVAWERDMLRQATLWWVGEDMVDLLLATASGVPDDVVLGDLPRVAPAGLVVFAKPWWGLDTEDHRTQVQVDAMLWGGTVLPPHVRPDASPEGVLACSVSSYRRLDFDGGLSAAELALSSSTGAYEYGRREQVGVWAQDAEGRLGIQGPAPELVDTVAAGATPHPARPGIKPGERAFSVRGVTWCPLGRSDWPAADAIGTAPWAMSERAQASYVEDRKVLAALWTLVHQEGIASRVVHEGARATRRRMERAGLPREASQVQVVTLRRLHHSAPAEGEPQGREYSHRWLVQGHWRWQPCGPGRTQRRLTFVRPHVKGPDDKPLVVRERVNAWVR